MIYIYVGIEVPILIHMMLVPNTDAALTVFHMRLVMMLLRRRREILRFEITELLLSVMTEL